MPDFPGVIGAYEAPADAGLALDTSDAVGRRRASIGWWRSSRHGASSPADSSRGRGEPVSLQTKVVQSGPFYLHNPVLWG